MIYLKSKPYIKQCYLIVWSAEKIQIKNGRIMLSSKCTTFDSKEWKFIKRQEARGLLSNLARLKVPILSDLPIANILV